MEASDFPGMQLSDLQKKYHKKQVQMVFLRMEIYIKIMIVFRIFFTLPLIKAVDMLKLRGLKTGFLVHFLTTF